MLPSLGNGKGRSATKRSGQQCTGPRLTSLLRSRPGPRVPPWFGLKDFEHMLEGLRKAGWSE